MKWLDSRDADCGIFIRYFFHEYVSFLMRKFFNDVSDRQDFNYFPLDQMIY